MKVLNFGSINIDYVYGVKELVKAGETISSLSYNKNIGGKGLNQSIAFARAGFDIFHAGRVGKDGGFLIEYLNANGIDTDNIYVDDGESGHAIIQVSSLGQNSIILNGGANQRIDKSQIDEVLSKFTKGDYLILQNEVSGIDYIIEKAHAIGMEIAINIAPINGSEKDLDLTKVSIINVNETEAFALTNKESVYDILNELNNLYPNAMHLLTLGDSGSICNYNGKIYKQSVYKVKAVDTTSAGDTFFGYFLKEYLTSKNITKALDLASRAAAVCVTRKGASASIPRFDEL